MLHRFEVILILIFFLFYFLSLSCLYPLEMSLKEKIETICREMYGAVGVEYSELAEQRLAVSFSFSLITFIVSMLTVKVTAA